MTRRDEADVRRICNLLSQYFPPTPSLPCRYQLYERNVFDTHYSLSFLISISVFLFTSRWPYSSLTRSGSSIDNISAAGSQSSKIISDFLFFTSSTDLQISDNMSLTQISTVNPMKNVKEMIIFTVLDLFCFLISYLTIIINLIIIIHIFFLLLRNLRVCQCLPVVQF